MSAHFLHGISRGQREEMLAFSSFREYPIPRSVKPRPKITKTIVVGYVGNVQCVPKDSMA
jgi:hypothetical protein